MFTIVGHDGDGQEQHAKILGDEAGEQAAPSSPTQSGSLLDAIVREGG